MTLLTLALLAVLAACSDETNQGTAIEPQTDAPVNAPAAAPPAGNTAAIPAAQGPALAIDGEGLRLFDRETGSSRPLPFGLSRADVLRALEFRGPPDSGRQEECGAGPLDYAAWPDGLRLYFQRDKLAGWAVDKRAANPGGLPAIATAASIGPGSTRAEMEGAVVIEVRTSSLGTEFQSGGISGIFDGPNAGSRISDMWAGASCVAR